MTSTPTPEHASLRFGSAIGEHNRASGWLRASAVATTIYALLLGLLVVVIYSEDHSVVVPLVALSGAGFGIATMMVAARRRWTAWLAAVYALIALAADGPHQIPDILHPQSLPHTAGSVILIVVALASLAIAGTAGLRH